MRRIIINTAIILIAFAKLCFSLYTVFVSSTESDDNICVYLQLCLRAERGYALRIDNRDFNGFVL